MTAKKKPAERRSGCPIAISLDLFGDKWSLLIVRDLLFRRPRSYRDFADAAEGIATNILADRLARLEISGIISRVSDPKDGRRVLYTLTEKGLALAPVLAEMGRWAVTWENTAAPEEVERKIRTDPEGFVDRLTKGWVNGSLASIKLVP